MQTIPATATVTHTKLDAISVQLDRDHHCDSLSPLLPIGLVIHRR
ncbi:hypothetical protein AM1_5220 [Acaryochloris marina MBIC11017]|uniref:Uncharacterized protein n=1 Tax=Acaryochloris marina (strain MBIC 11017) TaxID=329726 RepID=B0C9N4_ACAM1|nr:hypothetical protein AM1_5220 [Acaryochloris marina MBIC11017]